MAVDGYLNFDTRISTKGFSKGINAMNGMLGKLASAIAAAFSTAALIAFGKEALQVASDMQEVQNVVDTAFGEMAYKMEQFANTSVKLYGISRLAAKQTGSSFAAMASGMGLAAETAADMSISLTALSADMASFYNKSQEEVKVALASVFTGETETLKRYGILITEVNLQEYARQQGITKSIAKMTQQEKVMLRYNYVMQATALAQGDFARTSGSWANQTRILTEQWKEFMLIVGNALMQVALPAVKRLNDALSSLISYADGAYNALARFFGWQELEISAAAGITTEISSAVDEQNALTEAAKETANVLAGFDKINKLASSDTESTGAGDGTSVISTPNVVLGLDGAVEETEAFSLKLGGIFDPLVNAWNEHGAPLIASIKAAFAGISEVFSGIGASFAEVWQNGTAQTAASTILQVFTNISNTIGTISERFATAWNSGTGTSIVQGLANLFQTILGTIQRCSSATAEWSKDVDFEPLLTAVDGLLKSLQPFAQNVGEGLEDFYTNVLLPLSEWVIEDAAPVFLDTLSEAIDGISAIWDTAAPVIKELWDEFLQPIAAWAADAALKAIDKLGDFLKDLGESIDENDVRVMLGIAGAIGAVFFAGKGRGATTLLGTVASVAAKVFKIMSGVVGKVIGILFGTIPKVVRVLSLLWRVLSPALSGVLSNLWTKISTALSGMLSNLGTKISAALSGIFTALKSTVTFSVGTVLTAIGSALAGWSIGSLIYDIMGEEIDDVLHPFFDAWLLGAETIKTTWVDCFEDLGENVYDMIKEIKTFLSDGWDNIKKAFSDAPKWASDRMQDIKDAFSGAPKWFSEKFQSGWSNIKNAFSAESVKTWFTNRNADIEDAFANVDGFLSEKFGDGWENIKSAFADTSAHFKGIWEDITQAFADGDVGKWFSEQFQKGYDNVTGIFDELDGYFDGIWEDLSSGAKEGINCILDKLNVIGVSVEELLNNTIDALNSALSFSIPDNIPSRYAGMTFGLNLSHVEIPDIPKLATGTVVPANYGEFLAILGDNRREAEIVSPISAMEKAMQNVLTKHGGGDIHLDVNLNLDGKTVYKTVIRRNNESIRMTGKNPLNPS